jgi:hypothetical protein
VGERGTSRANASFKKKIRLTRVTLTGSTITTDTVGSSGVTGRTRALIGKVAFIASEALPKRVTIKTLGEGSARQAGSTV